MVAETSASLYPRVLCMIMVKHKLFIEHIIFRKILTMKSLLWPQVGVAPQCVFVVQVSVQLGTLKFRSKRQLDLDLRPPI